MGRMQQMGEMLADGQISADRMKHTGTLMGGMGAREGAMGLMGSVGTPEMSKMMEHMADMQKRMSDMMGASKWRAEEMEATRALT